MWNSVGRGIVDALPSDASDENASIDFLHPRGQGSFDQAEKSIQFKILEGVLTPVPKFGANDLMMNIDCIKTNRLALILAVDSHA